MKTLLLTLILLCCLPYLTACDQRPRSAEETEAQSVEDQQRQFVNAQPTPVFEWSLERHMMVELYRSRNAAVATYTLTWDALRGKISWGCHSIGYPLPGGTQLTNPDHLVRGGNSHGYWGTPMPQAEPNGLYSPEESAGTYVMCANGDGTVSPIFIEDEVRTFPVEMIEVEGRLQPAPNTSPSVVIHTTQR